MWYENEVYVLNLSKIQYFSFISLWSCYSGDMFLYDIFSVS